MQYQIHKYLNFYIYIRIRKYTVCIYRCPKVIWSNSRLEISTWTKNLNELWSVHQYSLVIKSFSYKLPRKFLLFRYWLSSVNIAENVIIYLIIDNYWWLRSHFISHLFFLRNLYKHIRLVQNNGKSNGSLID